VRILRKKKSKLNQSLKKTLQDWLSKVIIPETDGKHKARLQKKAKVHFHGVEGETARAKGHKEPFAFSTGKPIATEEGHVHVYSGEIIADDKMVHRIEGTTGPAIEEGDYHYHKATGYTTLDDQHLHKYAAKTSSVMHKAKRRQQPLVRRYATAITPLVGQAALPVEKE